MIADLVLRKAARELLKRRTCDVCGKIHAPDPDTLLKQWGMGKEICECDCCELTPEELHEIRGRLTDS